jgi:hypothetical protein
MVNGTTSAATNVVSVFEGMFDYLSALVYYDLLQPRASAIILNSLALLTSQLPWLSRFQRINAYLDNDLAGRLAFEELVAVYPEQVCDYSWIYAPWKDFNDYLIHSQSR